jgi:signal transduction histidine kinase
MTQSNRWRNNYIYIIFIGGAAGLILIGILAFHSFNFTVERSKWVDHTQEVLRRSELLFSVLKDAETGMRGYIISHDSAYLEFHSADSVQRHLQMLNQLTLDNAFQQQKLKLLQISIQERLSLIEQRIQDRNRGATEEIKQFFYLKTGKKKMDQVRELLHSFQEEETQLLASRTKALDQSINQTKNIIGSIIVIYLLMSMIFFLITRNSLIKRNLHEAQLHETNEELATSNEELAATIEALAATNEELATTVEELQAANEEVFAANDQLAELNLQLEVRVAERVSELSIRNEELQRANNDLDDFVYTAAHDLKSPVNTLEGLVTLFQQKMAPTLNQTEKTLLDLMTNTCVKLKRTIGDLTQILRAQKEQDVPQVLIRFEEVYEDVKDDILELLQQSEAQVTTNWMQEDVRYAHKHLRSILYNLLSNALKYRSPHRQPEVHLETISVGERTKLVVTDNGLGISAKHLPNIFLMFRRFHIHVDGSGIGLYTVKRIIENNEGSIEVESELDKGTKFIIHL